MWNRFCLWWAVFFLNLVNEQEADKWAEWDTAQNYMEQRALDASARTTYFGLQRFGRILTKLAHRANERADDVIIEAKHDGRLLNESMG